MSTSVNNDYFQSDHYQRHNQRRQEHLATLGLPLHRKSVLEVGAGIGDHTSYFLDRGCTVTSTDGRVDLLSILKKRHRSVKTFEWDAELSPPNAVKAHQIVYCYGLLYHIANPDYLLRNLANLTSEILLLETCVSYGEGSIINTVQECQDDPTQALNGMGCRPTRSWILSCLKSLFPFAYITRTQPWHIEFPLNWDVNPSANATLSRAVFVASRSELLLNSLTEYLVDTQTRC